MLINKNHSKALGLFDSLEEAVEYTEDFGFDKAQADILVDHMNQPTDAAELHFREGRIFAAFDLLLESPATYAKCLQYIISELRRLVSCGVKPEDVAEEAAHLFSYVERISEAYQLTEYDNMLVRSPQIWSHSMTDILG